MLRHSLRLLIFLLLCLSLFLSIRLLREYTGGFRLGKVELEGSIQRNAPFLSQEVKKILSQPFTYLDQGCQSYVFESQDQQYVLKLLRCKRFSPPFWLDWVKVPFSLERKLSEDRRKNFSRALESYQIAFSSLQKETKLVYIHLQKSCDLPFVLLKNRLFQTTLLDLNQVGFLIQKRAIPMKKVLLEKRADRPFCHKIVSSFVDLVFSMQEKQIRNRDYNCVKNAGVDGEELLFLDVGSFAREENELSFFDYEERATHFLKHFYRFAKNAPDLVSVLDEEIAIHLEKKRKRL
jgi:hypothetical protein